MINQPPVVNPYGAAPTQKYMVDGVVVQPSGVAVVQQPVAPNPYYKGSRLFFFGMLFVQTAIIAIYGAVGEFDYSVSPTTNTAINSINLFLTIPILEIMMVLGFGLLLTFLRTNTWSSIGYVFWMVALTIQLYVLYVGTPPLEIIYQGMNYTDIQVGLRTVLAGVYACLPVLISYGALLGKVSPFQLLIMVLVEVFAYTANELCCFWRLFGIDSGKGFQGHAFGALFGLIVAKFLTTPTQFGNPANASDRTSNQFGFIGTLFLWVCLPIFNSALTITNSYFALVNTVLALCASTFVTFGISQAITGRFSIDDVLRSTLVGGVLVASFAELLQYPYIALIFGAAGGALATLCNAFVNPWLEKYMRLHDTNCVFSLHFLPGVISGGFSILFMGIYPNDLYLNYFQNIANKPDWRQRHLALNQLYVLLVTLGFAIVGGVVAGILMKLATMLEREPTEFYDDRNYWTKKVHGDAVYIYEHQTAIQYPPQQFQQVSTVVQ